MSGFDDMMPTAYEEVFALTKNKSDAATGAGNLVIAGQTANNTWRYDSPTVSGATFSVAYISSDTGTTAGRISSYSDMGIKSSPEAVEGLTVSLAAAFAPNIRVNCVAPSLTKSKIAEPMLKNITIAEGIAKAHPLKRLGEGKDSASLAKFLITEDSSWITGQIIAVDGGRSKLS